MKKHLFAVITIDFISLQDETDDAKVVKGMGHHRDEDIAGIVKQRRKVKTDQKSEYPVSRRNQMGDAEKEGGNHDSANQAGRAADSLGDAVLHQSTKKEFFPDSGKSADEKNLDG